MLVVLLEDYSGTGMVREHKDKDTLEKWLRSLSVGPSSLPGLAPMHSAHIGKVLEFRIVASRFLLLSQKSFTSYVASWFL